MYLACHLASLPITHCSNSPHSIISLGPKFLLNDKFQIPSIYNCATVSCCSQILYIFSKATFKGQSLIRHLAETLSSFHCPLYISSSPHCYVLYWNKKHQIEEQNWRAELKGRVVVHSHVGNNIRIPCSVLRSHRLITRLNQLGYYKSLVDLVMVSCWTLLVLPHTVLLYYE